MRLLTILLILASAACVTEDPSITSTEQNAKCDDDDDCPEDPLPSCEYCDEMNACHSECRDDDGHRTTCAEAGMCLSCEACGPDVPCDAQCVADGRVTTCETQKPECQRFDVYCAFPLIVGASISHTHEGGGESNGPEAYMYFRGSGGVKAGNYPTEVGQIPFDPNEAWASNFRGPVPVPGGRTQWEWTQPDSNPTIYPYIYGHGDRCKAVPAGSPRPVLSAHTERVYEDDECWGFICNTDDHVGNFTLDRSHCEADVFGRDVETAFSQQHAASVTGSVKSVDYRLWCYSCLDSPTDSCSEGVVW